MRPSQTHFTNAQLRAQGLTGSDIRAQLAAGTLTRIRRGVYADNLALDPVEAHLQLIRATVPAVAPTNVLSHQSAGCVHGLPVPQEPAREGGHDQALGRARLDPEAPTGARHENPRRRGHHRR
ncbi:type IV toxin-antitoxin system AbiEi family antitoxin domain-containing protein [Tessaracoccus terricola]